jgi:hypothetical protein
MKSKPFNWIKSVDQFQMMRKYLSDECMKAIRKEDVFKVFRIEKSLNNLHELANERGYTCFNFKKVG